MSDMVKKKPPGKNISNDERHTAMVLLRLDPDLAERFRAVHAAWKVRDPKCTLGDVLEAALDALDASGSSARQKDRNSK